MPSSTPSSRRWPASSPIPISTSAATRSKATNGTPIRPSRTFKKKNGLADNSALQAYFNKRLLRILTKHGKKMVGWDEIFQPGLPTDIVIHSWRGQKALVEAAGKGYQGILSNGWYIDLCQPAEYHYLNDPVPAGLASRRGPEEAGPGRRGDDVVRARDARRRSIRGSGRGRRPSPSGSGRRPRSATSRTCTGVSGP
ncbi:MAG: family 20 glycosylhydrolase [Candidatus Moduliflexus flocculans]|nr:family 20 glycosylhydrolase [Candidatus Moduliflexus flocculans]